MFSCVRILCGASGSSSAKNSKNNSPASKLSLRPGHRSTSSQSSRVFHFEEAIKPPEHTRNPNPQGSNSALLNSALPPKYLRNLFSSGDGNALLESASQGGTLHSTDSRSRRLTLPISAPPASAPVTLHQPTGPEVASGVVAGAAMFLTASSNRTEGEEMYRSIAKQSNGTRLTGPIGTSECELSYSKSKLQETKAFRGNTSDAATESQNYADFPGKHITLGLGGIGSLLSPTRGPAPLEQAVKQPPN